MVYFLKTPMKEIDVYCVIYPGSCSAELRKMFKKFKVTEHPIWGTPYSNIRIQIVTDMDSMCKFLKDGKIFKIGSRKEKESELSAMNTLYGILSEYFAGTLDFTSLKGLQTGIKSAVKNRDYLLKRNEPRAVKQNVHEDKQLQDKLTVPGSLIVIPTSIVKKLPFELAGGCTMLKLWGIGLTVVMNRKGDFPLSDLSAVMSLISESGVDASILSKATLVMSELKERKISSIDALRSWWADYSGRKTKRQALPGKNTPAVKVMYEDVHAEEELVEPAGDRENGVQTMKECIDVEAELKVLRAGEVLRITENLYRGNSADPAGVVLLRCLDGKEEEIPVRGLDLVKYREDNRNLLRSHGAKLFAMVFENMSILFLSEEQFSAIKRFFTEGGGRC